MTLISSKVTAKDSFIDKAGERFSLDRRQIVLAQPIKALGVHSVAISLHPEVEVKIEVNVARSEDEAERQARGEDVTMIQDEELELETFDPAAEFGGDDDGEMPTPTEGEDDSQA